MEEAEVKQLISLIESAQLQYDVDESGTVSFVCDPGQLVSTDTIENGQGSINISAENILSNDNEDSEATKGDAKKDEANAIVLHSGKEEEEGWGTIQEVKVEIKEDLNSHNPSALIQQIPRVDSPVNYYLQTSNGKIIQVLDSLEDGNEDSSSGVVQSLEGITSGENLVGGSDAQAEENMEIFLVDDGNGEKMFLINTTDGQISQNSGVSTDVSQALLKNSMTESTMHDHTNKGAEAIIPLASDSVSTEGPLFTIALVDDDNADSRALVTPSKNQGCPVVPNSQKKLDDHPHSQVRNKEEFMKLLTPVKSKSSDKDTGFLDTLPNPLEEGSIVDTDRGKMMAYNLSSLMKEGISGKHSSLHDLAMSFGSWVKVLKPIAKEKEEEEEVNPTSFKKRFSIFSCEDCGTILHSEKSLRIHRRRFHEEWQDECFICGRKFPNLSYVRNHIKDVHMGEKSFECRHCSFRCSLLKEFYKHCRVHRDSQKCSNCGEKYASPQLFQDHIPGCKGKVKLDYHHTDNDGCDDKYKMKIDLDKKNETHDKDNIHQNSLDFASKKRRWMKSRQDLEYKVESKHYSEQIKKLALEQPKQTRTRGRDRTHRCYLCFKLFPNDADLEAHKEVYHQAKSSQPVRVKTDDSLGRDEEDGLEYTNTDNVHSLDEDIAEEVQIKQEPADISEKIENVTIVIDEFMNLSQVIKPLCIACRSYTKTDFSQSCRLFQTIAKCDQLQALKRFQSYFPNSINPDSLMEQWVLCKKCSMLVDKIADMEEQLLAMKKHWLSRFQARNEGVSNSVDDGILKKEEVTTSVSSDTGPISDAVSEAKFDIEKLIKEKFEIFEIIPSQKRKRQKNQETEKLAPVLLSDDEQEQLPTADPSKTIGRLSEEVLSVISNTNVKGGGVELPVTSACVKSEIIIEDLIDKSPDVKEIYIKSEPSSRDIEAIVLSGDTSSLGNGEGNHLVSSEQLSEDNFLVSLPKTKKVKTSDDESLSLQSVSLENDSKTSHNKCEGMNLVKALKREEFASLEPLFTPQKVPHVDCIGEDSINVQPVEVQELSGKSQEVQSKNTEEDNDKVGAGESLYLSSGIVPVANKTEVEKSSSSINLNGTLVKGKKRAKIREKRNKMCFFRETNAPGKQWLCTACNKGFSTVRGACDHYAASHDGKSYSCEECNVSYVRKRDLIGHYNKIHLKTKPYKCKSCDATFSTHSELYRHVYRTHTHQKDQGVFLCDLCDSSFTQKRYRDAHREVCEAKGSTETPYTCQICDKSFKLEKYIRHHMRNAHSNKNDIFYCEICNKLLSDKRNLILHMKSHSGESKTVCNICNKQFKRKSYLWAHMKVHTNERPYGCNYCSMSFRQYSTWKNHERRHTGEKPFKCSMCSSCFATKSSVTKHLQYAHYNIRNFSCDYCKKSFISKTKLLEHCKTHTGEKPFSCPICGRAFSRKTNLKSHMYIHTPNKKFRCEICGEGFMRRMAIENHMSERHGDLGLYIGPESSSSGGKGRPLANPFVPVVGAEDLDDAIETYIVLYPKDEDKESEGTPSTDVTIFSEDLKTTEVDTTGKNSKFQTVQSHLSSTLSSSVLPEAVVRQKRPAAKTEVLPTISPEDEVTIPIHDPNQMAYL